MAAAQPNPATELHGLAWLHASTVVVHDDAPRMMMIYTCNKVRGGHGTAAAAATSFQALSAVQLTAAFALATLQRYVQRGLREMFVTEPFVGGAVPAGMEVQFSESNTTSAWVLRLAAAGENLPPAAVQARAQQVMHAVRDRLIAAIAAGPTPGPAPRTINRFKYWAARWAARAAELSVPVGARARPLLFLMPTTHWKLAPLCAEVEGAGAIEGPPAPVKSELSTAASSTCGVTGDEASADVAAVDSPLDNSFAAEGNSSEDAMEELAREVQALSAEVDSDSWDAAEASDALEELACLLQQALETATLLPASRREGVLRALYDARAGVRAAAPAPAHDAAGAASEHHAQAVPVGAESGAHPTGAATGAAATAARAAGATVSAAATAEKAKA